jgi:hypothetical protein
MFYLNNAGEEETRLEWCSFHKIRVNFGPNVDTPYNQILGTVINYSPMSYGTIFNWPKKLVSKNNVWPILQIPFLCKIVNKRGIFLARNCNPMKKVNQHL